jgi:hypothetical protein
MNAIEIKFPTGTCGLAAVRGCFALEYRRGAEYLLFLRRGDHSSYAQSEQLTPYWAPLGPTNEQLFGGGSDPWLLWVRGQLRTR